MVATIALLIAGLALLAPGTLARSCPHPAGQSDSVLACVVQPSDTGKRRPRAIEYSDWYARRLEIHRIGSYTELPLFAAEWTLGNQLLHGADPHSATGHAHALVASGIGVLFVVNTGTGLWNLWDSRQDPAGRTRRLLHSGLMLASDAGFLWTGAIAGQAKRSNDAARRHRNVALGSIGLSTIGTVMMWLWKS